jgi:hypothetical protein
MEKGEAVDRAETQSRDPLSGTYQWFSVPASLVLQVLGSTVPYLRMADVSRRKLWRRLGRKGVSTEPHSPLHADVKRDSRPWRVDERMSDILKVLHSAQKLSCVNSRMAD